MWLPSPGSNVVQPPAARGADRATIHVLSGPDREGRMAHVEDHAFAADKSTRRHLLKTVCIDGTQDDALFVRPGGALWVRWGGLWRDSGCAPPAGPAGALQNS